MKRAKHTLSHYRMHTCNMGELVPIQCVPVLPGDTMQGNQTIVIRVSPLNTPVMHPVTVRAHTWFVPNRLVWPQSENGGWEEFITAGPTGTNQAAIPTVTRDGTVKDLLSYLGVPPASIGVGVNAMPLRATNLIYNQRYRDQDLVTARGQNNKTIPFIAWEKDDLTVARPFTQKGPDITLPIGSTVPVVGSASGAPVIAGDKTGTTAGLAVNAPSGAGGTTFGGTGSAPTLEADLSQATQLNINAFREGFALQRYAEARARYGSRFVEYLRYLGISPSDSRLQEPEYISGGTARLNFSEVLQTTPAAQAGEAGVGDLYGHGIAGVRTPRFRKFFEEHGYLITLLSVRPKATYLNGTHREFIKQTREDYFQRELANLGQQDVKKGQVFLNQSGFRDVWGYQDRYEEYRRHPSYVGEDFRDKLNSWHLGRELDQTATLNQAFVECKPSRRIFQITDASVDSLWIMANNSLVARRMVPKRANPRIL